MDLSTILNKADKISHPQLDDRKKIHHLLELLVLLKEVHILESKALQGGDSFSPNNIVCI
jgi:hypothetical protein